MVASVCFGAKIFILPVTYVIFFFVLVAGTLSLVRIRGK